MSVIFSEMLWICVVVSTLCTTIWALKFENCATSPFTTAFHWSHFDMHPLPVIVPDRLYVDVNVLILKNLTTATVDTEMYRKDPGGGAAVQVPCTHGTNTGTCKNMDLCTMIDRMNNKNVTDTASFQEQIVKILLTPPGNRKQCPILATPSTERHATIPTLQKMLLGDYMLRISVKDGPASTDNIGCIKFNLTVVEAPTPPSTVTPPPTTTLTGPLPPDHSEIIPVG